MLVFIDESGDPGFLVDRGATLVFVAAMVIFANGEDARATERVIRDAMTRMCVRPEFKFNKNSRRVRDEFFQVVKSCPFSVRAIVVRKDVIYSPHMMSDKESFYCFFVRQMMTHDGGALDGATVIIDDSGDRAFRRMLGASLRRQLGSRLREVRFARSESDPLVQLADMCAGAIARSYRKDRKDAGRWRRILGPRIDDVWSSGEMDAPPRPSLALPGTRTVR